MSHQVSRMARRGLVDKTNCTADRRGAYVELTEEGRRAIEAAAPGHVAEVRRRFLDPLSDAQLDALAEAAQTVLDAFEAAEAAEVAAAR